MGLIKNIQSLFTKAQDTFIMTVDSSADRWNPLARPVNYFDQDEAYTFRALRIISNTVSKQKPKLRKKTGSETEVDSEIDKSPILRDLYHFNRWMTLAEARKLSYLHLYLTGLYVWYKDFNTDDREHKIEYFVLDPTRIKVGRKNELGYPISYEYEDGNGQNIEIPRELLLIRRNTNPENWLLGKSEVEAARYPHNTYELSSKFNMNALANSGRPDGMFIAKDISEDNLKRLSKQLKQQHWGTRNAKRVGLFDQEIEWVELGRTHKDLEYIEGLNQSAEDVVSILGVPLQLIKTSGSTFANVAEAQRIFQEYTIEPLLLEEEEILTRQVIPMYASSMLDKIWFYFDSPITKNEANESSVADTLYNAGVITLNEARERMGYEKVEDGDDFKSEPAPFNPFEPAEDVEEAEEADNNEEVKAMLKSLHDKVDRERPTYKQWREDLKEKKLQLNIEQEGYFRNQTKDFFVSQAQRVIDSMQGKRPSMKGFFENEEEKTQAFYKGVYMNLASIFNDDANMTIKSAIEIHNKAKAYLFHAKGLPSNAMTELANRLSYFVGELTKTSRDRLQKELAKQIASNADLVTAQRAIADIFNGFVDGVDNVATLRALNVYKEAVSVSTNNVAAIGGDSRYMSMLDDINSLSGDDLQKGLRALKGLVFNDASPEAQEVNTILETTYDITDRMVQLKNSGISVSRSETIARTEINSVKNLISRAQFENNPVVVGDEWLSARDSFVRPAHIEADGQQVKQGEAFIVDGESLMYPGDSAGSAGNTINCRCTTIPVIDLS